MNVELALAKFKRTLDDAQTDLRKISTPTDVVKRGKTALAAMQLEVDATAMKLLGTIDASRLTEAERFELAALKIQVSKRLGIAGAHRYDRGGNRRHVV